MKYIKLLLCFCFLNIPFLVKAADLPENNSWSWKHHYKMREQERLKALLTKQINESGSSKTITAIVETKPTASKVGSSMMKRLAASGGGQMIGVLAVTQLIEAIGWVMEDGTYVKKIPEAQPDNTLSPLYQYTCNTGPLAWKRADTVFQCGQSYASTQSLTVVACYYTNSGYCSFKASNGNTGYYTVASRITRVDPMPEPTVNTVTLTPAQLGAAMLGAGYSDPDPNFDSSTVNNDQWTGVPDAYTPDPSGVGNELAEELESKANGAPSTSDGKASSFSDPKYQNDISSNDNANDRSWQSGDGTQGSTDTSTSTDPETGATSSSGSFNLPAFCDWAMSMCQWYDDWKKSDQVQKDHMTKTQEHQTEEKSFWEEVKDWFDWTKEPVTEEPETEPEEPDTQGIFDRTFDTAFSLSKQCPPDIPYSFNTQYFSGSFNLNMNWLCIIFTALGYPLVFASHCIGMWILYQAVIQREIKW